MMLRKMAYACATLAIFAMSTGCKDLKPTQGEGKVSAASSVPAGPKVKLEFFVMSKCPFGSQVEKAIQPVIEKIGPRVDFSLHFIADEKKPGQFTSMHGDPEVKGDIIQLCAISQYPDPAKYLSFINCQNEKMRSIPQGWEACATRSGLDVAALKKCYEGDEGKRLLGESAKLAKERGARGSPTIYLAGQRYSGGREPNDFLAEICSKMEGEKPQACSEIPEPAEVKVLVVTDKRCKACKHQSLANNLRMRFFPKLTVDVVDYGTERGKKLYNELKLDMLPVWLFDKSVTQSPKYKTISRWMSKQGDYFKLRVPANFDPKAEICDNKVDDTGNGQIDCDDPTCKETLLCREEKKGQVEVFVMSQCPYGVRALDAMKEVLANFKGKLKFNVHYIADEQAGSETGFRSLHGAAEVKENIRQLCAKKYYGRNNKYLDYIWCRNKEYRKDDWQKCAVGGIAASRIERCSTSDEGKQLLRDDIKIGKALKVSGSPTWLANNRFKFSGIAADQIKDNICKHNPALPNCDKKLTKKADVPAGSCK